MPKQSRSGRKMYECGFEKFKPSGVLDQHGRISIVANTREEAKAECTKELEDRFGKQDLTYSPRGKFRINVYELE